MAQEEFTSKSSKPQSESDTKSRLLDGMVDRISDGLIALDKDWQIMYANRKAAEILNREKPEDLMGNDIWVEFPEAIGSSFYVAFHHAMETQEPDHIAYYFEPWDRWFDIRIYPSSDGLTLYFADISVQKQTESAFQRAEARLELAVKAANVGLWDWDLKTNNVYFSPEWKKQIGYDVHEISNDFSEWATRVHPDDLESAQQTAMDYIANPYPKFQNEFRFQHKDGTFRSILAHADLLYDEHGKPTRMLGSHVDISEQKHMQEELSVSENLFSNAFHSGPAGMAIARTSDGVFIDANEIFCKMFEFKRDEVIGHTSIEMNILSLEQREQLKDQQLESRGLQDFEIVARAKSGRLVTVLFSTKKIEIAGEACQLTAMVDITERKRAEAEIKRQLKETQLLYQISQLLHDLPDSQALTQQVVNILENVLQYPNGAILLIDQESGGLTPFALSNQGQDDRFVELDKIYVTSQGVGLDKGITGWVARTGQSVRTGNVTENEHYIGIRDDIQSELCLPLILDNQVIGVFNTESDQPDAYDELDQQFLETVVAQIALSIRNTILVQKVHDSEGKYQSLVEHASDGIFVSNAQGYYLDVNTSGCKMLGYSREELIGKHLGELVAGDNLATQPLKLDELKAGTAHISERILTRKDGSLISIEVSGTQLPNGNLLGIVRDITDRKQAANKLLYERNILRTLIDNLPHQIYIKDTEGQFVLGNNATLTMSHSRSRMLFKARSS